MSATVEQWGVFELTLDGPSSGNPFVEVAFSAVFTYLHRSIEVAGFYDGDGRYQVRFMPDAPGEWVYVTRSNAIALAGQTGSFMCAPAAAGNHGPVRVRNTFHFAYADGTPYWPFGTTCYAWTHQPSAVQAQTLDTLRTAPFNKLRMCVFPKHYTFNLREPLLYPYEKAGESWDFTRFHPAFFRHFEQRVADLLALGIEADVILLHPYDRWGFANMGDEADARYLRYVVARLAAYRNVWWSMANEYDITPKPLTVWDRLFQIVQESDPYGHLRSIHNWVFLEDHAYRTFYDFSKPWVTHCSIQHAHCDLTPVWREQYRKPVVIDEACYEGDLPNGWGNITGEEMTHRFWEGFARGGYVGHGETYLHPETIWWSHGGTLRGTSPARIAFLRQIIEDGPPDGLNPVGETTNTHMGSVGAVGEYYLTYFGVRQPAYVEVINLPDDAAFQADILDTWGMSITPMGVVRNHDTVRLPSLPYLALRLKRV